MTFSKVPARATIAVSMQGRNAIVSAANKFFLVVSRFISAVFWRFLAASYGVMGFHVSVMMISLRSLYSLC